MNKRLFVLLPLFVVILALVIFPETEVVKNDADQEDNGPKMLNTASNAVENGESAKGINLSDENKLIVEHDDIVVAHRETSQPENLTEVEGSKIEVDFSLISVNEFDHPDKIDSFMLQAGTAYQLERSIIRSLKPGQQINLLLNDKEYYGQVASNQVDSKRSYLSVMLPENKGRLTLQLGENTILGRLREENSIYKIEGYGNQFLMVDLIEYKIEKDALKHD